MSTTFESIYEDWMLPIINDYKIDKLYTTNKEVLYEFLSGFLKTGLSVFGCCVKSLAYHSENIIDTETMQMRTVWLFDEDLDDDEKKIISKIAVANYWKRQNMDIKARLPYINQREFKKDAIAPVMKQNDNWYENLVSEYLADIEQYQIKHIEELPFWGG